MKTLNWKPESMFKCSYRILENYSQVGYIKRARWQKNFTAELNGQQYTFKPQGFFKRESIIVDRENNTIGLITKDNWNSNAVITVNGQSYPLAYTNAWQTKWSIKVSFGNSINYNSNGYNYSGNVTSNENNNLLILAGLYTNFWKLENSLIVIMICFIPIWITIFPALIKFFFHH